MTKPGTWISIVLLLVLSAFSVGAAQAAPAKTCNSLGKIAERPNGKIVGLAEVGECGNTRSALVQFNADGRLDRTWGTGGYVFPPTEWQASGPDRDQLLLRPNGEVVLVREYRLVSYFDNGDLDAIVGYPGVLDIRRSVPEASIDSAVLQPDGKIVLAGWRDKGLYAGMGDLVVSRFTPRGEADLSFGFGGYTIVSTPEVGDKKGVWKNGGVVTSGTGNQIYVAFPYRLPVTASPFDDTLPTAIRLSEDGVLDPTFGADGTGFAQAQLGGMQKENAWDLGISAARAMPDGVLQLAGTLNFGLHPIVRGIGVRLVQDGAQVSSNSWYGQYPVAIAINGDVLGAGTPVDERSWTGAEVNPFSVSRSSREPDPKYGYNSAGWVYEKSFGQGNSYADDVIESVTSDALFATGKTEIECDEYLPSTSCGSSLTLVKIDADGKPVDDFGVDPGLSTIPRICSTPGYPFVCRATKVNYGTRAVIKSSGLKGCSIWLVIRSLGDLPKTDSLAFSLKLPKALRVRKGKFGKSLYAKIKRTGQDKVPANLVDLSFDRKTRVVTLTASPTGGVGHISSINLGIRQGGLKPVNRKYRKVKLKLPSFLEVWSPDGDRFAGSRILRTRPFVAR